MRSTTLIENLLAIPNVYPQDCGLRKRSVVRNVIIGAAALSISGVALAGSEVTILPGSPPVPSDSDMRGLGYDGSSAWGSYMPFEFDRWSPYRWTATGGIELLAVYGFDGGDVFDASLDSREMVGIRFGGIWDEPVVWGLNPPEWAYPAGPSPTPPVPSDGVSYEDEPLLMSGNGGVIVRNLRCYGGGPTLPFRHSRHTGLTTFLSGFPNINPKDPIPSTTVVTDTDASGHVLIGYYSAGGAHRAFVHRNGAYNELPIPAGNTVSTASAISANGRFITGSFGTPSQQCYWKPLTPTGPFVRFSIPAPPGATQASIEGLSYNGRLLLISSILSSGAASDSIYREGGGFIEASVWTQSLSLPAGWSNFVLSRFSIDGRTAFGTAVRDGVTQPVRVRGYDLEALLGTSTPYGEFFNSPIVMPSTATSSVTLDTRAFMEGRSEDACFTTDHRDGWFSWTAPSTGIATASHCPSGAGPERPVTLAVYNSSRERLAFAGAGSFISCGTNAAKVNFGAVGGQTYLIRVSLLKAQIGFETYGTGSNGLVVNLFPETACAIPGSCYQIRSTPGCSNAACCVTICAADPYCCDVAWDTVCRASALTTCGNCGDPDAGSCFAAQETVGCADATCCGLICPLDAYCCDIAWDLACAAQAIELCTDCGSTTESCTVAHATPACSDTDCCASVCAVDPYCCSVAWDGKCVAGAAEVCVTLGDINADGVVNAADLSLLLAAWGSGGSNSADLDGDGTVGAADLSLLLANWG